MTAAGSSFASLEGAQAGLKLSHELAEAAFITVVLLPTSDPAVVARFNASKIVKQFSDPCFVCNRLKVNSVVRNSQAFLKI